MSNPSSLPPKGRKPKVAFLCVHNACRSQIAEAMGKLLASDVFESYSAGTQRQPHLNPDAVRLMKELYHVDMERTQSSKLLSDIPTPDVVILMGCQVQCPVLPGVLTENWGLDDPTGQGDDAFRQTIAKIEQNVRKLKEKLQKKPEPKVPAFFTDDLDGTGRPAGTCGSAAGKCV